MLDGPNSDSRPIKDSLSWTFLIRNMIVSIYQIKRKKKLISCVWIKDAHELCNRCM